MVYEGTAAEVEDARHGRHADTLSEFPGAEWKDILFRVYEKISECHGSYGIHVMSCTQHRKPS